MLEYQTLNNKNKNKLKKVANKFFYLKKIYYFYKANK